MAKAKVNIEVTNLDVFETLVETLNKYRDQLPRELKEVLIKVSDQDVLEIDIKEWKRLSGGRYYKDNMGIKDSHVLSINTILRRIKTTKGDLYPDSFKAFNESNETIIEW